MNIKPSPLTFALGASLIAGMAALAGCGRAPVTQTMTTTERTTTIPAPVMPQSTTTVETIRRP